MIKARPVAGDIAAAEAFLAELQPYVWRKYMDYAAIADVHSIKRQIHAHKGHGEIAVKGHNVKLGRGGIREIEFFVQTQQLIAGGRFPDLRGRETVPMLEALAAHGWITAEARDALTEQYWFLRRVEHAIQMVADEQTHMLPEDDAGLERIAHMLGFADADAFSAAFRQSLHTVERHYAALFETAPQLSAGIGNLVFTGDVDDPDTLQTLASLGFKRPSDICRVIRGWHFGRYRATQSAEARERLTELTPALLQGLRRDAPRRQGADPLRRLPGRAAGRHPAVLAAAFQPVAAEADRDDHGRGAAACRDHHQAPARVRRPARSGADVASFPTRPISRPASNPSSKACSVYEEILDRLRIFNAEQKFLIGVRLLTGAIDAARAGKAFSDLADLTIGAALDAVLAEFAARHGRVRGIEGGDPRHGQARQPRAHRRLRRRPDPALRPRRRRPRNPTGRSRLPPSHYFTRLTQRLIAAVSAPTAEGVLYELDLRLRPSGNKGPVATHIESFRKYQRQEAWTWEHMALTRARVVAGDAGFAKAIAAEIDAILGVPARPRQGDGRGRRDARDDREGKAAARPLGPEARSRRPHRSRIHRAGGRADRRRRGERAADRHRRNPGASCAGLRRSPGQAGTDATPIPSIPALTQIMRLCLTGPFERDDVPPGLSDLLLRQTDLPDFGVLEAHLKETAQKVREPFRPSASGEARVTAMGRRRPASKRIGGYDATGEDDEDFDQNCLAFLTLAGVAGTRRMPPTTSPAVTVRGPAMMRFDRLDADQSGDVTFEEFSAALKSRIGDADKDHDGKMTVAEIAPEIERMRAERMARRIVERFDIDGDGMLTAAEIESRQKKMFALLDRNDDGKVVKDEMPRRKFRHGDHGGRW